MLYDHILRSEEFQLGLINLQVHWRNHCAGAVNFKTRFIRIPHGRLRARGRVHRSLLFAPYDNAIIHYNYSTGQVRN